MIDKALKSVFSVVAEEAANNRTFAKNIEDALIKYGQDLARKRELEEQVERFNPYVEFKSAGVTGLETALKNRSVAALKQIVQRHNVDPANTLGPRPARAKLVAAIVAAAEKRAARDAKLFEY